MESWDDLNGQRLLKRLAAEHPDRYMMLLVSLLPRQVEADLRDVTRITTAELLAKVLPRLPDSDLGRSILAALPQPAGNGYGPGRPGGERVNVPDGVKGDGSPDNGDVIDVGDDADAAIEAQPSTQVPTTPALTRDGQSASANVPPESQDDGGISRVPQITQPPSPIPTQDTD